MKTKRVQKYHILEPFYTYAARLG